MFKFDKEFALPEWSSVERGFPTTSLIEGFRVSDPEQDERFARLSFEVLQEERAMLARFEKEQSRELAQFDLPDITKINE